MSVKKKVLWIDDELLTDGYLFYEMVIKQDLSWELEKATCMIEAAKLLSDNQYDAIILDQQFPLEAVREDELPYYTPKDCNKWMGAALFFWLNGLSTDWLKSKSEETMIAFDTIKSTAPNPQNSKIPVLILTVTEQEEIKYFVDIYKDSNSHSKHSLPQIEIRSKPLREPLIKRFLTKL